MLKRHTKFVLDSEIARFIMVGGVSFAIDLGLLMLLHEVFAVDLVIATPIAFLTSLGFIKYCLLVVFNTLAIDVIVNVFDMLGAGYQLGKVVSTIMTTAWNYLLYKHWIFKPGVLERKQNDEEVVIPRQ